MIGTKKEIRMSSRESILEKIKANKPSLLDLPKIDKDIFVDSKEDQLSKFKKMIDDDELTFALVFGGRLDWRILFS